MEETTPPTPTPNQPKKDNAIIFYIIGGLIVTAIIVAGFVLIPKQSSSQPTAETEQTEPVLGETNNAPQPTTPMGPIGSLACEEQFYNTVNGVPQTYYLSTDGEVPTTGGQVTCTISASVNNQIVASEQITPVLVADPSRGGSTFTCSTQGLKLTPGVPTKVTTDLTDANGLTASCNRTFLLP
jgi:hypothetical protein